jgi:hypothetical protein
MDGCLRRRVNVVVSKNWYIPASDVQVRHGMFQHWHVMSSFSDDFGSCFVFSGMFKDLGNTAWVHLRFLFDMCSCELRIGGST